MCRFFLVNEPSRPRPWSLMRGSGLAGSPPATDPASARQRGPKRISPRHQGLNASLPSSIATSISSIVRSAIRSSRAERGSGDRILPRTPGLRPPGIFPIRPAALATFMRSSRRRRPSIAAARVFGCCGVPGGRPACTKHRDRPRGAGCRQRPPELVRALQRRMLSTYRFLSSFCAKVAHVWA